MPKELLYGPDLLPMVGVLRDRFMPGISNLEEAKPPLAIMGLREAIETRYATFAHFCTYQGIGSDDSTWPRCNKMALPHIRNRGMELLATMMVFDYDTVGHIPWTEETLAQFLQQLDATANDWPVAWDWTCFYTTRKGARFVYVLDQAIPVDEAEGRQKWMVQEFHRHGIEVDTSVFDWTRIYALPLVRRDDTNTWEDALPIEIMWQEHKRLAVQTLGKLEVAAPGDPLYIADRSNISAPLIEEVENLVAPKTDWYEEAKKRLKGRECFDCLFDNQPIADKGRRNDTIHRYVGQATSLLIGMPTTTPEHIYALFLPSVMQLKPDTETPDWTLILWSTCNRIWAKEEAKLHEREAQEKAAAQKVEDKLEVIWRGMQKWCNRSALFSDDKFVVANWIKAHSLAYIGNFVICLGPNGLYEPIQLSCTQVIPHIRRIGMDDIIPTTKRNKEGDIVDASFNYMVNRAATVVKEIRAVPQIEGGYIENIDTSDAVLVLPSFRRNPNLTPQYDADVDEWLHVFFGENYDKCSQWIAWALAFDEGSICALSICGAPGTGKKLLSQGLAECLAVPKMADTNDICSGFQYGLAESPFLLINEGWPSTYQGKHPADMFRTFIGESDLRINRKNMHPVMIKNCVRCLLTANNLDLIRLLTRSKEVTKDDRDALNDRLLHVSIGKDAAEWIKIRGGFRFTGKPGKRWIASDGAANSDFVLARHFMWLYANRGKAPGTRFLVDGGNSAEVVFEMRTASGSAPLVIEAVIGMLNLKSLPQGMVIEGPDIYCVASAVLNFYRVKMAHTSREKLAMHQITNTLSSLSLEGAKNSVYRLGSAPAQGFKRWTQLDTRLLLTVARRDGWRCDRLEMIVQGMDARKGIAEIGAIV